MSVITLTSDIGLQDYMIAAVKGQLMQACPETMLVDISHQVAPFNFPQAAYLCRSALPHFPHEAFHFILVNLFDRSVNYYLLAYHKGHYFCCADNGLLSMIMEGHPEQLFRLYLDKKDTPTLINVIKLFSGAVNGILSGKALDKIGEPVSDMVIRNSLVPAVGDGWIEGQVIYVDNFENVVINITREQFEAQRKGRDFRIYFKRDEYISHISDTYADVAESHKLALFNTAGYLEIAINKGNAAGLFGLQGFNRQQLISETYYQKSLFYQSVKIIFE
jgi:S-adenosylmethionine hydrolase